ncbi:MAG: hypothetical protein EZS28_021420 [Streblomastix strix]|uniref:SPRY domain-containing protein n=1 Tax=Streblomastix strix TaxID=222440 RepID=A0A5J4VKQ7_9EUKA|nr:MAG: hypothetical protein EZS28_021420 [Streblomastix strix]
MHFSSRQHFTRHSQPDFDFCDAPFEREATNLNLKTAFSDLTHISRFCIPINNGGRIKRLGQKYFGSVWCKGKEINGNKQFKDNQIVRLEMDCEEGTLTLFLDDVQQPLFISGIKEKVRFIV